MFLSIIETINENGKIIMDAMDCINTNQVQIDKSRTKSHEKHSNNISSIWKGEMKAYKMNKNLVSILSTM
jgi:hypothetical protein